MISSSPGYDRPAISLEDVQEFRQEAEKRDHAYELIIDGIPLTKNNEGTMFMAESENEAIQSAYWQAWIKSCRLDKIDRHKEKFTTQHMLISFTTKND